MPEPEEKSKNASANNGDKMIVRDDARLVIGDENGDLENNDESAPKPKVDVLQEDNTRISINVGADGSSVEKISTDALPEGTIVAGKYEIMSLLGRGGMSSVYKVKHIFLSKVLALKMIHPHLASDKDSMERFKREAEATSRLDHPNVVAVHDFGISENGSPFILMDLVQGVTLAHVIKEEDRVDHERVLKIIIQACSALEHAHSRNIVHRDIKPSNIMLVNKDGEPDYVKVVDFGIAQLVAEDATVQKLTQTGQIFATPLYMSPEQCQGQKLDARTDIYSLGAVMYEALAGKPPIVGTSVYETIFKQINTMPEDFDSSVGEKNIRQPLQTAVFTAMAKLPAERYESMASFQEDLQRIRQGEKQSAFAGINMRSASRQIRSVLHRFPMVGTILSLALLIGVAASVVTQNLQPSISADTNWHQMDKQGQEAFNRGQFKEARAIFLNELKLARQMKDSKLILASLQELSDLDRAAGKTDPAITNEIHLLQKPDEKVTHLFNQLNDEFSRLPVDPKDELTRSRLRQMCGDANDVGMSLADDGDRKTALELINSARKIVEQVFGEDDPLMLRCLHNLANIAHNQGKYAEAISGYKSVLELETKLALAPDPAMARTKRGLARAYIQMGVQLGEAEKLCEEAMEINRKYFGPESKEVALCRYLLAALYQESGRSADAQREAETAISIYEHLKEGDTQSLARSYSMLGNITNNPNYCLKALALFEDATSKDYNALAQTLRDLARLSTANDPTQAEAYLCRAAAIAGRFNKVDQDMLMCEIAKSRVDIFNGQGKKQLAELSARQAVELSEKSYGTKSLSTLNCLCKLAKLLDEHGKTKEAEETYQKAFVLLESSEALRKINGNSLFLNYVRFFNKLNRESEAQSLADRWRRLIQPVSSK